MGWMFTSEEQYPKVFSFSRDGWVFLAPATAGSGQFFDYNAKTWTDYGTGVVSKPIVPAIATPSTADGEDNSNSEMR